MKYIAYLTGNRREINTSSPKALLVNIKDFRDHCWVKITSDIAKLQPAGHKKAIKVEIEAKIQQYLRRGTEQAETLIIKKIRRIK